MTTVLNDAARIEDNELGGEVTIESSPAVKMDTPPMTLKQWLQILSAFSVFLNTW